MKNKRLRIAIRPMPSPEAVVCLAPAIAALKLRHTGAAVGLVASEELRESSLLLPDLDFFATEAEDTHADYVVDLAGTERYDDSAEDMRWKTYLLGSSGLERGNPYHLIDLQKKAAKVDTLDVNFELSLPEVPDELPEALGRAGLRVAVCAASLSANEVEAVLEGISRLSSPAEVFLLGSVKDKRVSTPLSNAWDGKLSVHDLCGRLSLVGTAAVLRACDIAVAAPGLSAVMASGFGTFTILVDDSPSRGPLFYPYGHGHLAVQRAEGVPVSRELAPFLKEILGYALSANSGNVPTLEQWQEFADSMIFGYLGKVRLFATQRIEIVFKDTGSFTELYLRPLLFTGSEPADVLHTFYRLLWEHSLGGRTITTYDLQVLHHDTMPALCDLLKPLEQLYELANFGRIYSGYVRESLGSGDVSRAKHESQRLQEVEELIQALATSQPFFAPLHAYHRQEQALMENESPIGLAKEMTASFTSLQERVLVLLDLAKSLFHTVFENEGAFNKDASAEANSDG